MGLCNSPDIFQERMSLIMEDLDFVRAYIDNLLCVTAGTYEDHLEKLGQVFEQLHKSGLKAKNKSFFIKDKCLIYWIS